MLKILMGWKKICRALDWISKQFGWIGGALTGIMIITGLREVVGRYFFRFPSDWSLELNGYLLVGLVYLSAAYTELVDGHIRIDYIYIRFKGKTKKIADAFISIIGLCWSAIVVWLGAKLAWHSYIEGARSADAMMWPLFPSQVVIPIGASLLGFVLICKLLNSLIGLVGGVK